MVGHPIAALEKSEEDSSNGPRPDLVDFEDTPAETAADVGSDCPPAYLQYRPVEVHSRVRSAPYRYVSGELERTVSNLAVPLARPGSRVLDYGCADQPYRWLFGPGVEYVGADLGGNESADVTIASDGSVPLPGGQFDLILSTQVLEHVAEPDRYISECYRLLKPGGSLVITTHGIMYYHPDPDDYWRWTSAGLTRLLANAGMSNIEVHGIMGLAPTAVQLFQRATVFKLPVALRRPYVSTMQALVQFLDRFYSDETRVANALVLAARAIRPAS
jgi:SAM-dependent methyltransferase